MNNGLIFSVLAINTLSLLFMLFWLINKNCPSCQQEMSPKRIFTFKAKCQACEEANHE